MISKNTKQKFSGFKNYNSYLNLKLKERNLTNNDLFLSNQGGKFYGRITLSGEVITPPIEILKQVPGSDSQYALNFVCDAFEHLIYLCSSRENIINSRDLRFINISPLKAYNSLENKYDEHILEIFDLYLNNIKLNKKKNKIINFDTFIVDFIKFINITANKIPILKSDFIIGSKCNVLDSGLAIELINIEKNEDFRKITEFWEAPEFYKFIQNCKKTGFVVDKEYPWRIVFNVNLEESQKYLNKYNVNSTNFTNLYTIVNEITEINNLKKYMILFYNKFCSSESEIQIPYVNQEGKVVYNNHVRNKINMQEMQIKYPNEFWFKIYSHIYFIKYNIKLNQKQYNEHMNKLTQLFKSSNNKAIEYLNNILNTSQKSNYRTYEFSL